MLPASSSYAHPENGSPPGQFNPPGTPSLPGMNENQPSTAHDVEMQVYFELWQQILANTMEPRDEGNEAFSYSGTVSKSDSHSTLHNHCVALRMLEVKGDGETMFSALQAAIDKQSWPFIPHIRETHLVQSEKFPHQPSVLVGCNIRSYTLDQRIGTLKLLTLRGIVVIGTLSERFRAIGMDPNIKHALNCVSAGGLQKIIQEASFARRKGNESNASQFLVFGLRFGSMREMGYIFCKDPEDPNSGPTGHITLTYPASMMEDASRRQILSDKSKEYESFNGSATSDFVQGPATAKPVFCPYCSNSYVLMDGLRKHLQQSLEDSPNSDDKHPKEEISDFLRNSRKGVSQGNAGQ